MLDNFILFFNRIEALQSSGATPTTWSYLHKKNSNLRPKWETKSGFKVALWFNLLSISIASATPCRWQRVNAVSAGRFGFQFRDNNHNRMLDSSPMSGPTPNRPTCYEIVSRSDQFTSELSGRYDTPRNNRLLPKKSLELRKYIITVTDHLV